MSDVNNSFNTRRSLIQRVLDQHDEVSWETFVRIYRNYIYSLIRKMNLSHQAAEELTQDVLIKLWKKLPETELKKITRFRSWVAAITRNCVIDYIRKQNRDTNRMIQASEDESVESLRPAQISNLDELAETQWKTHITNLALENITPFFSGHAIEVFELSLQGFTATEIAEKLDILPRSVHQLRARVKTRLAHEIQYLRKKLE